MLLTIRATSDPPRAVDSSDQGEVCQSSEEEEEGELNDGVVRSSDEDES
jgi:hypothetical protein